MPEAKYVFVWTIAVTLWLKWRKRDSYIILDTASDTVGSDVSSDTTLLDYLRFPLELRGTKFMCREGSCGACIVSINEKPGDIPKSVNACLVSIASCQDWEITTVEAVGNWHDGYHPIQKAIAAKHGTQCGYCTPGWVMAMFSLMKSRKNITVEELERSFGSNLCRCTGYRPIIEALRLALKDASNYELPDIEELKICNKTEKPCDKTSCHESEWCIVNKNDLKDDPKIKFTLKDGKLWHVVEKTSDIFNILALQGDDSYMLISGNTAKGAYPIEEYSRVLIDISRVQELKGYNTDQNLIVGAGTKISELMEIFETVASNEQYFKYLKKLRDHIDLVAHIPVRNIGSIAGNLMIKYQHRDFPSDIFLLCETVGANVTILSPGNVKDTVTMQQFLNTDMRGKVLFNVLFPPLSEEYSFETYKIMPRAQNAHPILNAGFLFKTSKSDNKVIECKIVYGGLSKSFIRASETEKLLVQKDLFTNKTLQEAVSSLEKELPLEENPPEPSAKYRKHLAIALFYKCLLSLCPPEKLDARYRSGAIDLKKTRPVSKALHEYTSDASIYPLNQPIQKVEALMQTAGEAPYTEDFPSLKREVFAAYVTSTVALGTIDSIDPSKALKYPGVVAFFSAKDIPGQNNFIPVGQLIYVKEEEVLCSGEVKYYDQPIGVIVAETYHIAERAAKMVEVKYKNIKKPVIDIKEAKKDPSRNELFLPIPAINRGIDVAKVIKTEYTVYGQHHYCMETMCCVTVPTGESLEVHTTTQWSDAVQVCISKALKIQQSKINIYVPRLGGAYGVKISRNTQLAIACGLVSQKLNRPCRFIQSLSSMMKSVGKRLPCSTTFEVGVSKSGVIQYMDYDIYEDVGYINSELMALLGIEAYHNCYDKLRWNYKCYSTTTDNVKNTFCRAPVTMEHISMAEWIMEQISYELSLDPLDVRFANLDLVHYADYKEMVKTIKEKSQYQERREAVNKFNENNRWKKRGLRWSFTKWSPLSPSYYNVNLSVFHGDGTVILSHGGVEMGQGINTIAVQVCAHILNIPIEKIQIKRHDTTTTPNSFISGSSVTTQNIARGVTQCCTELLLRLAPVRLLLLNPPWEVLIKRAFALNIDLQVHGFIGDLISPITTAMGVTLAEAEIDVLTGEFQILRVDLLEDVGRSINPEIDVGQVEGAFIMGMGYWTSEKIVYSDSGKLLSDRIWNYHVPQVKDIPQDFRVYFKQNSFSTDSLQGAKVTGEPPITMSCVIPFAIREAIVAARLDSSLTSTDWFGIDGSYTVENVCMATATNLKSFIIK